jgi:hypothetical protein
VAGDDPKLIEVKVQNLSQLFNPYLYRWWPLRQLGRVYAASGMTPVDVRVTPN